MSASRSNVLCVHCLYTLTNFCCLCVYVCVCLLCVLPCFMLLSKLIIIRVRYSVTRSILTRRTRRHVSDSLVFNEAQVHLPDCITQIHLSIHRRWRLYNICNDAFVVLRPCRFDEAFKPVQTTSKDSLLCCCRTGCIMRPFRTSILLSVSTVRARNSKTKKM